MASKERIYNQAGIISEMVADFEAGEKVKEITVFEPKERIIWEKGRRIKVEGVFDFEPKETVMAIVQAGLLPPDSLRAVLVTCRPNKEKERVDIEYAFLDFPEEVRGYPLGGILKRFTELTNSGDLHEQPPFQEKDFRTVFFKDGGIGFGSVSPETFGSRDIIVNQEAGINRRRIGPLKKGVLFLDEDGVDAQLGFPPLTDRKIFGPFSDDDVILFLRRFIHIAGRKESQESVLYKAA